jgi:threonine/homoserine/homoserine lactone efflux protein
MMSKGQLIFALFFIVIFAVAMIIAYRKDIAKNKPYYKGTYKTILAIVGVYVLYFALTKIIH